MEGHRLRRAYDDTSFLTTAPADTWTSRSKTETAETLDYAPATGRREMKNGDYELLEQRLQEFAGTLVGGSIFRGLHSLVHDDAKGRIPSFAFVIRDGRNDEMRVYEFIASDCAFVRGAADPQKRYLAGAECWATDLLAVLGGELDPIALNFGRARLWNASPERLVFDLFGDLHRFSHPLRRPAEYLRTYHRIWAKCADVEPMIFRN